MKSRVDKVAEFIKENPYGVIITFLIGAVALIIAIVTPIIQAKNVRLSFSYTSNLLQI